MIVVCGVTAFAIYTADYSDAWILLCAVLIMDSVRNFLEFAASRGMIELNPTKRVVTTVAIWIVGILVLWVLARSFVPTEITGDFRIMGVITLALTTISLINWACNFKSTGKQR